MTTPYYFTGMLAPGIGKETTVLTWHSENPIGIVHVISRHEIETMDFSGLLEFFGPHTGKQSLRRLLGQAPLAISGYELEAEEIYEIPEVRKFLRMIHSIWPAWIYAASPESPSLLAIAFASCPNIKVARTAESLAVEVDPVEMQAFFDASRFAAWLLRYITNVAQKRFIKQVQSIAGYLSVRP